MISTPMMQIVLDAILFFGLSSDEVVSPDEAVKQLEGISTELQKMPLNERLEFLRFVDSNATAEEKTGQEPERVEFLRQIGENLGIAG